jgi:serine/threonine-protein kinase RsbW
VQAATTELNLQVLCDESAPVAVREALREFAGIGWILGDAMLVASELVTDAVLHSGCDETDLLDVEVRLRREQMTISVRDPAPATPVAQSWPADMSERISLWVVQQLADRYGAEGGVRHHVWAEVALPSGASPAAADHL